jgi:hypothetical protein
LAALYSNENFPLPVVAALRQLGHDVTWSCVRQHPEEIDRAIAANED